MSGYVRGLDLPVSAWGTMLKLAAAYKMLDRVLATWR